MAEHLGERVLCAAEDEADRHAWCSIFRSGGFDVLEAATGGELVRWAVERPALIFLAGSLGHLEPCAACRYLKSDPAIAAIPVLVLFPGPLTVQDRAIALECGADDYLGRPVEAGALLQRVQALRQAGREQAVVCQRSGLTKGEAEDLLDWLESNGYPCPETAYVEGRGFVVRWRGRPKSDGRSSPRVSLLEAFRRVLSRMWSHAGKGRR